MHMNHRYFLLLLNLRRCRHSFNYAPCASIMFAFSLPPLSYIIPLPHYSSDKNVRTINQKPPEHCTAQQRLPQPSQRVQTPTPRQCTGVTPQPTPSSRRLEKEDVRTSNKGQNMNTARYAIPGWSTMECGTPDLETFPSIAFKR